MKKTNNIVRVNLVASKADGGLVVRLSAKLAKQLGVATGDVLLGEMTTAGQLILKVESRAVGKAEIRRTRKFLTRQKVTVPVSTGLRRDSRY